MLTGPGWSAQVRDVWNAARDIGAVPINESHFLAWGVRISVGSKVQRLDATRQPQSCGPLELTIASHFSKQRASADFDNLIGEDQGDFWHPTTGAGRRLLGGPQFRPAGAP
jgi:hypothetical protein